MNPFNDRAFFKAFCWHAAAWLAFICYDLGYVWYITGRLGDVPNLIFFYTCNISIFYCHYSILDRAFGTPGRRYFRAAAYIILEIALYTLVKSAWEAFVINDQPKFPIQELKKAMVSDLYRTIYFAGMSTLAWSAGHIADFRRKAAEAVTAQLGTARDKAELEARLARTENAYLQQQLHPHLLFNTLNFIYNAVDQHSPEGAQVVLLLADIMRFSLEEAAPDGKTELNREILQIRNLVAINQSRFHYPVDIDLQLPPADTGGRIIPLVLLTLTENLFKHGDFRVNSAAISLSVDDGGTLHFGTRNRKRRKESDPGVHGRGLQNTRLRLEYFYPSAYTLVINETPETFHLDLTLPL